jgi:putative ABC transport system permease protein
MRNLLLLTRYSLQYYRGRTIVSVLAVALCLYLPFTLHWLVGQYREGLLQRAEATPLVLGPRGSRFDLVFHALHFRRLAPTDLTLASLDEVRDSGFARPIPLHITFTARGHPVVGTDPEYFRFRRLSFSAGESFLILGEAVLGAKVASRLDLAPGDRLMTDPVNVFDLAGAYPLNLRVSGVLASTDSPDDEAVFVDIKTAWVIQGLGHGHENPATVTDQGMILARDEDRVVASAALPHFTEITPENLATFHFHGDPANFPLTALLCVPRDDKTATLLSGRYQDPRLPVQLVAPAAVIDELLHLVFRVKRFLDLHGMLVTLAVILLLSLVGWLSLRLRRREMLTLFRLGCSRGTTGKLLACEWGSILLAALLLATAAAAFTTHHASDWLTRWLTPG